MKALSEKIIILGIDGMDPRITKRFLDEGKLPNIQKCVDDGAQREDLVMLGALPTITPPMWTTLATGAYPNTHGMTCFWSRDPEDLSSLSYGFDSRKCKAEQLWNVFAEAGKKTMVWHWPGSSWPPTSDNPNLHVVDGMNPNAVNSVVANVGSPVMISASEDVQRLSYAPFAVTDTGAGCIIHNLEPEEPIFTDAINAFFIDPEAAYTSYNKTVNNLILEWKDGENGVADNVGCDIVQSPIVEAKNWSDAPEGAKEFTILLSGELLRRPALIVKNKDGIYDEVRVYRTKKETEPICILKDDKLYEVLDEAFDGDDKIKAVRSTRVLEIAPDGSKVLIYFHGALSIDNDTVFHPRRLYKEVIDHAGFVPPLVGTMGSDPKMVEKVCLPLGERYCQWQADALNYLIDQEKYEMIFSHLHSVDLYGHAFWHHLKDHPRYKTHEEEYQRFAEEAYLQADRYVGRFMHLLDEDWTIIITSDHGLLSPEEDVIPFIGDAFGCNVRIMQVLGYTNLKHDDEGNEIREIDWSKTKAVATRGNHIYVNLKGRDPEGIVDPKDKDDLVQEIISDLYNYRDPETGKRIIKLAFTNRDAALIGMSGPECGDIIYFVEEGFNRLHGDSVSTTEGYFDTSVSPIFIAVGKGLKKGFKTSRVIREVDVAPTVAVLGGVRMPNECEGAPVYQILDNDE